MSWIHEMLDIPEDKIDEFELACKIEAHTNQEEENEPVADDDYVHDIMGETFESYN